MGDVCEAVEGDRRVHRDIHARAVGVVGVLERNKLPAVAGPRLVGICGDLEPVVVGAVPAVLGDERGHFLSRRVDYDDAAHSREEWNNVSTGTDGYTRQRTSGMCSGIRCFE